MLHLGRVLEAAIGDSAANLRLEQEVAEACGVDAHIPLLHSLPGLGRRRLCTSQPCPSAHRPEERCHSREGGNCCSELQRWLGRWMCGRSERFQLNLNTLQAVASDTGTLSCRCHRWLHCTAGCRSLDRGHLPPRLSLLAAASESSGSESRSSRVEHWSAKLHVVVSRADPFFARGPWMPEGFAECTKPFLQQRRTNHRPVCPLPRQHLWPTAP